MRFLIIITFLIGCGKKFENPEKRVKPKKQQIQLSTSKDEVEGSHYLETDVVLIGEEFTFKKGTRIFLRDKKLIVKAQKVTFEEDVLIQTFEEALHTSTCDKDPISGGVLSIIDVLTIVGKPTIELYGQDSGGFCNYKHSTLPSFFKGTDQKTWRGIQGGSGGVLKVSENDFKNLSIEIYSSKGSKGYVVRNDNNETLQIPMGLDGRPTIICHEGNDTKRCK